MSGIFGGSKSKSTNNNRGIVTSAFQPLLGQAVTANQSITDLLGGNAENFNKFKDATGFDFEMMRGMDQIGSASAGRGVFRSGARDKALAEFGGNLNNRFAQQYLQTLLGQSGQALGAGQLVAGVGQESTSRSKPGIGAFIGQAASAAAASDERLKTDITPVGRNADGLTVYQYRYKGDDTVFTGVMAQEVAEKRPDALGPTMNGYMSVDYSKINIIDRS
jgi:hypothetical protein